MGEASGCTARVESVGLMLEVHTGVRSTRKQPTKNWVADKELYLSYYFRESMSQKLLYIYIYIYIHYGNLKKP